MEVFKWHKQSVKAPDAPLAAICLCVDTFNINSFRNLNNLECESTKKFSVAYMHNTHIIVIVNFATLKIFSFFHWSVQ